MFNRFWFKGVLLELRILVWCEDVVCFMFFEAWFKREVIPWVW